MPYPHAHMAGPAMRDSEQIAAYVYQASRFDQWHAVDTRWANPRKKSSLCGGRPHSGEGWEKVQEALPGGALFCRNCERVAAKRGIKLP